MGRENYYARVMLTSYPPRHWDVGDIGDLYAGEDDQAAAMAQAIKAGRAITGIIRHFKNKKSADKQTVSIENEIDTGSESDSGQTRKTGKGGPAFKYVAIGGGALLAALAGYSLWKAKRG